MWLIFGLVAAVLAKKKEAAPAVAPEPFLPTPSMLISCAPTLGTQLTLMLVQAILWALAIPVIAKLFAVWVKKQPWCEQWTQLNKATFKKAFFVDFKTMSEAFDFACLFIGIITQHALGGALCCASVFGLGSASLATTLAAHGALCEVGWEFQDVIVRAYQVIFGGAAGKAMNPTPLLVIMGIHHSMGLGMAIPMNLSFGAEPFYHEMVFLLQFAAAFALITQNYGYTLDTKTASGLLRMKVAVTLTLAVLVYSRVLRFAYCGYKLLSIAHASGSTGMLVGGSLVMAAMSLLNVLFVTDATGKFLKFMKLQHVDQAAPLEKQKTLKIELDEAIVSMACAMSPIRIPKAKKEWSKVRGAVALGVLRGSSSDAVAAETKKAK